MKVEPDSPARIVIDEKSGTIVIGATVRVTPVAVTHGSLTVRVTETPTVVQPEPLSDGETAVEDATTIEASQEDGQLMKIDGPDLQTLVAGLNRMGLKPTGIIAISAGNQDRRCPAGGFGGAVMRWLVVALSLVAMVSGLHAEESHGTPAPAPHEPEPTIADYCANFADRANDARTAWQLQNIKKGRSRD